MEGQGLVMREPIGSAYHSSELGVDKAKLVQTLIAQGKTVAYAGDGLPDILPSKLVDDRLRFARGTLAEALRAEGLPFQTYSTWSDIANYLIEL